MTTTKGIGIHGEDFYCINPSGYRKREYETLVDPGWRYSSDTNSQWLTIEQLREML